MEVVQLYKDKAKTQDIAPITDVKAVFNDGAQMDYVMETVNDNGWTCRKWASGWLECFGRFTKQVTWGGAGWQNCAITKPDLLKTFVTTNVNVAIGGIVQVHVGYTNNLDIWVYCAQATSGVYPVLSVSAFGYWK